MRLTPGRRTPAPTARRQPRPSSPADAAMRRPSHGSAKRSTRSPRTISRAGWNVRATAIETSPTITAPSPRLRSVVSGTSSMANHRQREGDAAEHHRPRGRAGDDEDRLAGVAAAVALFAQAGDDEQRVVDPGREAHGDDHVHDEQVQLEQLPDD